MTQYTTRNLYQYTTNRYSYPEKVPDSIRASFIKYGSKELIWFCLEVFDSCVYYGAYLYEKDRLLPLDSRVDRQLGLLAVNIPGENSSQTVIIIGIIELTVNSRNRSICNKQD